MGDKIESKIIGKKAGVNIIPGYDGVVKVSHQKNIGRLCFYGLLFLSSIVNFKQDVDEALKVAHDIGNSSCIKVVIVLSFCC